MRVILKSLLFLLTVDLNAQSIEVEFDKNKDMSGYRTFQFGEMEIITPKDKRIYDKARTQAIVNEAIIDKLKERGLQQVDSNAHLIVSYVIGSMQRSSTYNAGPFGGTPGMDTRSLVTQDYNEGSLIIDLNDVSDHLIWRVNAVTDFTQSNAKSLVDQVVSKGFRKFPNRVKSKKNKK